MKGGEEKEDKGMKRCESSINFLKLGIFIKMRKLVSISLIYLIFNIILIFFIFTILKIWMKVIIINY